MKNNNLTLPMHYHKNRKELKLLRADKPEMLIETDITYIPTNNGMAYLTCIKDIFSRDGMAIIIIHHAHIGMQSMQWMMQ